MWGFGFDVGFMFCMLPFVFGNGGLLNLDAGVPWKCAFSSLSGNKVHSQFCLHGIEFLVKNWRKKGEDLSNNLRFNGK